MEHKAVDPAAKGPVTLSLHRTGILPPVLATQRRESLGPYHLATAGMPDRRGLDATEVGRKPPPFRPELPHGNIRSAAKFQIGTGIHVIWFERQHQTMLSLLLSHPLNLVLDDEFLRGLPQVPKKSCRRFRIVDETASQCWQKAHGIITAPRSEFF